MGNDVCHLQSLPTSLEYSLEDTAGLRILGGTDHDPVRRREVTIQILRRKQKEDAIMGANGKDSLVSH